MARIDEVFERRLDQAAVALELNHDGLLEDILARHFAVALDRFDPLAEIRQRALEFDISSVFVFQAALEPPAHPGEPRGVERQPLIPRHLDRDRVEVAQEGRAA